MMNQTEMIREYFRAAGTSTPARCSAALGIDGDTVRARVRDLMLAGWLVQVKGCQGFYRFQESPAAGRAHAMQDTLWRAMRVAKRFTAWDAAMFSGSSLDYAKEYITFLQRSGMIKVVGKTGQKPVYQIKDEPPIKTPHLIKHSPKEEARLLGIDIGWALIRALLAGDNGEAHHCCCQLMDALKGTAGEELKCSR